MAALVRNCLRHAQSWEPCAVDRRLLDKPDPDRAQRPEPILSTGAGERMTPEQTALLRRLARAAYEPEAFSEQLTQAEAAERIAMLEAKLKLLDEPPHTL
ncbi:MAG: DUF3072 domain-containing protein [Pseudolabrys sp.]